MTANTVPLPAHAGRLMGCQDDDLDGMHGYTADQLRAYGAAREAAGRAAEREAIAAMAEVEASDPPSNYKAHEDTYVDGWIDANNELCWAIRSRPCPWSLKGDDGTAKQCVERGHCGCSEGKPQGEA